MKIKDFLEQQQKIRGGERADLYVTLMEKIDMIDLIMPYFLCDEGTVREALGTNPDDRDPVTVYTIANSTPTDDGYKYLSNLWRNYRDDDDNGDPFADFYDLKVVEEDEQWADQMELYVNGDFDEYDEYPEDIPTKPATVVKPQVQQHAFYNKLMSEMQPSKNPKNVFRKFLFLTLVEYLRYLKAVCPWDDIVEYDPFETLKRLYKLYEDYAKANNSEPAKIKNTNICMLLMVAEDESKENQKYIIDKLLIEPFRMLGKEKNHE